MKQTLIIEFEREECAEVDEILNGPAYKKAIYNLLDKIQERRKYAPISEVEDLQLEWVFDELTKHINEEIPSGVERLFRI